MRSLVPMCAVLPFVVLLGGLTGSYAQGGLPVNSPTEAQNLPAGTAGPISDPHASRKAEIDYAGGLLRIEANNSSLNQILREIGRLTGMKITGGVAEDRVFGTYGPASATSVLTSLLDGTRSNILIVENASAGPAELILTPRKGEPTPPSPASFSENAEPGRDLPQQNFTPPPGRNDPNDPTPSRSLSPNGLGPLPPSNGGQTGTPINGGADLGTIPGAFTPYGQTPPDATAQPVSPANSDGSVPDSSKGTITPQQIYQQLQRLRSQQQQPQTAPDPQ